MAHQKQITIQVRYGADDTFEACVEALQNLVSRNKLDINRDTRRVEAKEGMLSRSTSSVIKCRVDVVDDKTSSVQILSESRIPTQIFDFGQHESNVNRIEAELRRVLRQGR